jgi:regulator of protease activity HflC (stomatin/prohibitin superfamily)
MFETVVVVWVLVLILVVVTLFAGVKTVSQGQVWTVERFGAYTRMLQPGLNFVLPYVDQVGRKLNVQEQVVEIPEQSVITRDNATVLVDGIIYYRVMEPEKAAYQVTNLTLALTTLAMTNIRAVIGEMELDATLSSRERINTALLVILDGATEPWGVKVSRVEIRKIEPPENLIRAMNLQMTAERERRATVARAEGERQAAILRAEGEKQALILSAEGRQQAALRDAEARLSMARRGCATSSRQATCGHSRRWHRHRTRVSSWSRWSPPRLPAASPRQCSSCGAMTGRRAAYRPRSRRPPNRGPRPRACQRRCRRSRRHPSLRPGEPGRRDEGLDHLAGGWPRVAGDRDPRTRRVHDVARPRRLWHWPGRSGNRHRLRATGHDMRRAGGDFTRPRAAPASSPRQAQHPAVRARRPHRHRADFPRPRGARPCRRQRLGGARATGRRRTSLRVAPARGGRRWYSADRATGGMKR